MDFVEHLRKLNLILSTTAKIAEDYNNPSGIGDFRETSLIDILRAKLPTNLLLSKAEIMDSEGSRTPEFDIVITTSSETPRYFCLGERQVLPCEDVLMVGEIKSAFKLDQLEYFIKGIKKLNELKRYFSPTQLFSHYSPKAATSFINRPISPSEAHGGVSRIASFFFMYSSPSDETLIKHLNTLNPPENFLGLFSLNQSQIIKTKGAWTASPVGQKADVLFWLFFSIHQYCKGHERGFNITADVDRYYQQFIETKAKGLT